MRNKVKSVRSMLQITQQDLAEKVSVSRQSIIAIESGKYMPSAILAIKIARELNSKVEDLFELEEGD
jgi:putative transcriptional regulator